MNQTYASFHILLSAPEVVFKQEVENAPKTKGWLDDVGCKLPDYMVRNEHSKI